MATVYLARDRKHAREVALKVLKPEVAAGSDRRRFEREIGILARLHHPHILQLYDSGVLTLSDGRAGLFYVMPYVRGETLRRRMERDGALPLDESVHLATEVAEEDESPEELEPEPAAAAAEEESDLEALPEAQPEDGRPVAEEEPAGR